MKYLIVFIVLFSANCVLANYGNKSPKVENGWTDSCDECQTIIKRIVEVAKDPVKIAELKMLLSALCRETHYVEECRLFVSKIDLFLERLLPYLKDARHVCQELHICGNRRLEHYHRVGLFFARSKFPTKEGKNSLVCEECKFAAYELLTLVDDPNVQQDVQDWLEEDVCARMGSYKDECDQYLEAALPQFWQEMHNMLADSNKFCEELELCPASTLNAVKKGLSFKSFIQNANMEDHQQPFRGKKSARKCLECTLVMGAFRYGLTTNATLDRIANILAKLCLLKPKADRDGCNELMELYSHAIGYYLVQYYFGQETCQKLGFCKFSKPTKLAFAGLECESCRAMSEILEMELSSQKKQEEFLGILEKYLCDRMPNYARAYCRNLVESYVPIVIGELLRELQDKNICNLIHACK